jgi:aminopeptidase N
VKPWLVFTTALFISGRADAQSAAPLPGDGFHVDRYVVSLRPDPATRAIAGTETIVVTSSSDGLSRLAFSPNALQIGDATIDGRPADISSTHDAILVSLPHTLARGQKATLRLRMTGTPARGLNLSAGGLYTSYFACDWMVCLQDAPGDKADFALDLIVPAGWTVAAVGRALPTQALPDGLERHRWRSTRPYSAYLYAFAAGPFPIRSDGDLTYIDATGTSADLPQAFALTPAIAAFLSDKAGMTLPDHRYIQVLVPGDEAQESASFSLIGQSPLDRDRVDPASAWVVAHEMAHQWWGNLVTCATWQDLWLDEGVTTFMVAAWQQHENGDAAYQAALDVARGRVERARAAGFDKPLAWGGTYPSLGIRRAIQYSKAALFLAQLREDIGDDAFWKGLRTFTRQHAGGTVTSRDFQSAMEAASGRDLTPLFKTWVYGDA